MNQWRILLSTTLYRAYLTDPDCASVISLYFCYIFFVNEQLEKKKKKQKKNS